MGEVWFAILGMVIGAGVVPAVVMLRRWAAGIFSNNDKLREKHA